ncbi:membrane protein insertase YidC [Nocardia otitidiscaviarum]|uniref:membrane protein insertase YidC n=1 Tax=Nocardia otitidiscaviarum TaxID=1823 RepID=UPI0004A6B6C2|nr:membrane protein insertase YidC [Nocardia otitidiscaviarum]MBF6135830.1 membrane protein insertase YidC [Nocardia otitidiscaviarum]MBF6237933.1 membrane protein insertase YidC [Nocardia otitidiscaviarum]MBF6483643.1 membrane protein insertase YidC [Nocardia otitidiscaviarum]
MLDFIYYPVSAILWFWHRAFGFVLGYDSGWSWTLAVVFLVFTLRLVLYKPFVKQVRTTKQMQELQPQIKALQAKYKNDRQKMALEMQKLQKDHGFNPLMGCLPVLLQVPVFLGLFHVLRSFNRTGHGFGQLGLSVEENANTANYIFSAADVQSFLGARIFGAPLSAMITMPDSMMAAFTASGPEPSRIAIAAVSIPLMIIAGVATHFNARASVARQSPEALANPQAALMNKLALYVFPLGVLVGGPFLPVAILVYWVSNNIWTYVQQHLVFGHMEKEEEAKKAAAIERRAANAPKPGAKPVDTRKKPAAVSDADADSDESADTTPPAAQNGAKPTAKPAAKSSGGGKKRSGNRGRANQKKRR